MNQTTEDYRQNYFQNDQDTYDDYYENEFDETQGHSGDAFNLQVPNARLYTEGIQEVGDVYPKSVTYQAPNQNSLRPATAGLGYNYNPIQKHLNEAPPATYGFSHSFHESALVHENTNAENIYHPKNYYNNTIQYDHYSDNMQYYNQRKLESRIKEQQLKKNVYSDYKDRKFYGYTSRLPRSTAVKKYPVTIKTPKYVTKNFIPTTISKRPSALCLPVVTQLDPALVKRKPKQNEYQPKKNLTDQYTTDYDSYSAHKMHSQGDVKNQLPTEGIDGLLDQYEDDINLNSPADQFAKEAISENTKFKEFVKYIKPRVPSSIRLKQEQMVNIDSSKNLQPKLQLSLDKLLNRLQKCEGNDQLENESKTDSECKNEVKGNSKDVNKVDSFNYEALNRKCSPSLQNEMHAGSSSEPINSLFKPVDSKKMIRPMDDHCALDLHRSKSYIVDLIDRALSKELGTVPRDQSIQHDLTPNKAVANISRHRQCNHKELCYKVTAALTDSIISNATAPSKKETVNNEIVERSTSDSQVKERLGDDSYIKQLKQLRWGHIRHIQHEARKLADLEEFLEKCGEIEY